MKKMATATITLRDRKIIEHVARYRLTTIDVLSRASMCGTTAAAVRKIVARLIGLKLLQAYPLVHPTRYYVLGTAGAKSLGMASHRTLPLGPQSLPTELAVLVHCNLGKQPRVRLTRDEVLTRCPWLTQAMAAMPHCLNEQEQILELLRVDLGGPSDHVARKCLADVNARRRLSEFLPYVRSGSFRLVVVTATAQKAHALRLAIDRHDWPSELPIHFSIVSQLMALTARKNDA